MPQVRLTVEDRRSTLHSSPGGSHTRSIEIEENLYAMQARVREHLEVAYSGSVTLSSDIDPRVVTAYVNGMLVEPDNVLDSLDAVIRDQEQVNT